MAEGSAVMADLKESRACSSSGWHFADVRVKRERRRMKEKAVVAMVVRGLAQEDR